MKILFCLLTYLLCCLAGGLNFGNYLVTQDIRSLIISLVNVGMCIYMHKRVLDEVKQL